MCVHVYLCVDICMSVHACRSQQNASDILCLVLQIVVDCLKWVLGIEFRFCTRVICVFNQQVTFLALQFFLMGLFKCFCSDIIPRFYVIPDILYILDSKENLVLQHCILCAGSSLHVCRQCCKATKAVFIISLVISNLLAQIICKIQQNE